MYLPYELATEIMSRVPGKALARFRSVSKQFRSLLSDHFFLSLHHSRSRDSLLTLVSHKQDVYLENSCSLDYLLTLVSLEQDYYLENMSCEGKPERRYDFSVTNKANGLVHEFTLDSDAQRIRMLSSNHQLLCFVCETRIYLCNPVNKELKKLPISTRCFRRSGFCYNECLISFGFVVATNQYKVVKWPNDLDENRTRRLPNGLITTWKKVDLRFEVLSIDIVEEGRLKASGWQRLQRPCPYLLQLSSQIHVNGFIYWTTSDFQIVSFSLQDYTFSTLNPKPPCFRLDTHESPESRFFTLSGSRGSLWMIDYGVSSGVMDIWKMEDSGWAKIHKIDLRGTAYMVNDGKPKMLDIWSEQVLFKLSRPRSLICYHAKTNTLEDYSEVSYDCQLCHSTDGFLSLHNIDV